jgi:hypothetical protein
MSSLNKRILSVALALMTNAKAADSMMPTLNYTQYPALQRNNIYHYNDGLSFEDRIGAESIIGSNIRLGVIGSQFIMCGTGSRTTARRDECTSRHRGLISSTISIASRVGSAFLSALSPFVAGVPAVSADEITDIIPHSVLQRLFPPKTYAIPKQPLAETGDATNEVGNATIEAERSATRTESAAATPTSSRDYELEQRCLLSKRFVGDIAFGDIDAVLAFEPVVVQKSPDLAIDECGNPIIGRFFIGDHLNGSPSLRFVQTYADQNYTCECEGVGSILGILSILSTLRRSNCKGGSVIMTCGDPVYTGVEGKSFYIGYQCSRAGDPYGPREHGGMMLVAVKGYDSNTGTVEVRGGGFVGTAFNQLPTTDSDATLCIRPTRTPSKSRKAATPPIDDSHSDSEKDRSNVLINTILLSTGAGATIGCAAALLVWKCSKKLFQSKNSAHGGYRD